MRNITPETLHSAVSLATVAFLVFVSGSARGGGLYPIEKPITNQCWSVGGEWSEDEMAVGYALAATGMTSRADKISPQISQRPQIAQLVMTSKQYCRSVKVL